jgi:hypothetical protein
MQLKTVTRKDGSKYYRASGNCTVAELVAFAQQQLSTKGFFYRVTRDTNYENGAKVKRAIINIDLRHC